MFMCYGVFTTVYGDVVSLLFMILAFDVAVEAALVVCLVVISAFLVLYIQLNA